MTKDEALKLALEALEAIHTHADVACVVTPDGAVYLQPAITAIKEALAQPAQEPVAWSTDIEFDDDTEIVPPEEKGRLGTAGMTIPLYTTPQQRPWVGLTDEEVREICVNEWGINEWGGYEQCRAIEAKLKQKNLIAAGSQAFYGFPTEPVSTSNAGGKCVTAGETAPTHTLNSTKTVAVATDTYWLPIDKDTPRSAKLQLLSIGGVAQYGTLGSDVSFYTHWCPVPKKPK